MSDLSAVLIDDDPLVIAGWMLKANQVGKRILAVRSYQEFLSRKNEVTHNTPVFIDSGLGNNERGELRAQEIKAVGFEKVYLVTGYPPEEFRSMPWLDGVLGKAPPPWLF